MFFILYYFSCNYFDNLNFLGEHVRLPNGSFGYTLREPLGVVGKYSFI